MERAEKKYTAKISMAEASAGKYMQRDSRFHPAVPLASIFTVLSVDP